MLVIREVNRQPKEMVELRTPRVAARIVCRAQPKGHPVVRVDVGGKVECGGSLEVNVDAGYFFRDHVDWNNSIESKNQIPQVENSPRRSG